RAPAEFRIGECHHRVAFPYLLHEVRFTHGDVLMVYWQSSARCRLLVAAAGVAAAVGDCNAQSPVVLLRAGDPLAVQTGNERITAIQRPQTNKIGGYAAAILVADPGATSPLSVVWGDKNGVLPAVLRIQGALPGEHETAAEPTFGFSNSGAWAVSSGKAFV